MTQSELHANQTLCKKTKQLKEKIGTSLRLLGHSRSLHMFLNFFWGKVVLTATYLINKMPSQVLNFQTLSHVLLNFYPNTRIISTIPMKVFGCFANVHIHSHNRSKLDPQVIKCIFIGYSSNKKEYKCYSPIT